MGGTRATTTATEVFEPADPARTMPRALVLAAIIAVIIVVLVMSWLSNRSLHDDNSATPVAAGAPSEQAPAQLATPAAQPAAQGPVVLTATEPVWLAIKDSGRVLKQGIMQPGETYTVPADAAAPLLTTAKSEGLRINIGSAVAPPVGPPATKVTASLLAADLMKGPRARSAGTAAKAAPPAAGVRRRTVTVPPVNQPQVDAAAQSQPPAATTNTGQ